MSVHGFCAVDGDLVHQIRAVGVPYGMTPAGEFVVFNCAFGAPLAAWRSTQWLRTDVGPRLVEMVRQLREYRS